VIGTRENHGNHRPVADHMCAPVNYIDPRRWRQLWRQCNTTTVRNRGGVQQSGRVDGRAEPRGRGDASQRRGAVGCQPGRSFSSKVPAKGAVGCQWTAPGGGKR